MSKVFLETNEFHLHIPNPSVFYSSIINEDLILFICENAL